MYWFITSFLHSFFLFSCRLATRERRKGLCFCRHECPALSHLIASHLHLRKSEFTCAADPARHTAPFSSHLFCECCGRSGQQSRQRGEHSTRHAGEYDTARTGELMSLFYCPESLCIFLVVSVMVALRVLFYFDRILIPIPPLFYFSRPQLLKWIIPLCQTILTASAP